MTIDLYEIKVFNWGNGDVEATQASQEEFPAPLYKFTIRLGGCHMTWGTSHDLLYKVSNNHAFTVEKSLELHALLCQASFCVNLNQVCSLN